MLPFEVLHQLDPIPFSALRRRGGKFNIHCRIIPEPVEPIEQIDPTEARRRLGIPIHGRYMVSLGSGDARKGTDLLLRAFAHAKLGGDDRLLLMGTMAPAIQQLIEREMKPWLQDSRLILFNQYVSHEMFCLGLNAADVICTPYPRHVGSSGIVVRAAAIGKPILASSYGWVGAVVSTFGLGTTCVVSDIEEFSHHIEATLNSSSSYMQPDEATRFVSFHTLRNFSAHITARIRARRGEPSQSGEVSWDEVMTGIKTINPLLA
jgi:glycosyltransferase involved in cell wall biosynthesis